LLVFEWPESFRSAILFGVALFVAISEASSTLALTTLSLLITLPIALLGGA
jgi:hypothetical protein